MFSLPQRTSLRLCCLLYDPLRALVGFTLQEGDVWLEGYEKKADTLMAMWQKNSERGRRSLALKLRVIASAKNSTGLVDALISSAEWERDQVKAELRATQAALAQSKTERRELEQTMVSDAAHPCTCTHTHDATGTHKLGTGLRQSITPIRPFALQRTVQLPLAHTCSTVRRTLTTNLFACARRVCAG